MGARFLLEKFPEHVRSIRTRRITDNYIDGTSLRLRKQSDDGGETVFKLTQKLPTPAHGAQQGFTTTIYLSKSEFSLLAQLPAKVLRKTRYSVPPFGIDVFEGTLKGLVMAAEFNSAAEWLPRPRRAA
jgi:CYTH domain-containing protein